MLFNAPCFFVLLQDQVFLTEALRASVTPLMRSMRLVEAQAGPLAESPALRRMRQLSRAMDLLRRLLQWQVRAK